MPWNYRLIGALPQPVDAVLGAACGQRYPFPAQMFLTLILWQCGVGRYSFVAPFLRRALAVPLELGVLGLAQLAFSALATAALWPRGLASGRLLARRSACFSARGLGRLYARRAN